MSWQDWKARQGVHTFNPSTKGADMCDFKASKDNLVLEKKNKSNPRICLSARVLTWHVYSRTPVPCLPLSSTSQLQQFCFLFLAKSQTLLTTG